MLAVSIPVIVLTWYSHGVSSRKQAKRVYRLTGKFRPDRDDICPFYSPHCPISRGEYRGRGHMTSIPRLRWADSTAPLDIEVISLDWRWLFIYPHEGIASLKPCGLSPAGSAASISPDLDDGF